MRGRKSQMITKILAWMLTLVVLCTSVPIDGMRAYAEEGGFELLAEDNTAIKSVENIAEQSKNPVLEEQIAQNSEEMQEIIQEEFATEIEDDNEEKLFVDEEISIDSEVEENEAIVENGTVLEYAAVFAGCEEDAEEYKLGAKELADKAQMFQYSNQFATCVEGRDYVPNVIVVAAETEEEAEKIAELYSGRLVRFLEFCAVIELNADTTKEHATVAQAVQASMAMDTPLPAAWPDYYRYNQSIYNDPYLSQDNSAGYQWHHSTIGSQYAWANGYTGEGIKVTVIDSGLGPTSGKHIDLPDDIAERSYNKSSGENSKNDQSISGHGTHVSGLVGAKLNNEFGGAGVAPGCTLYSINADNGLDNGEKVGDGAYTSSDLIAALNYARTDIKTDIINLSVGGSAYQFLEELAVNLCYNSGIAIFAAAGNTDTDTPAYPALYKSTICIAALDKGNQKASFSSYGKAVDFAFPGANIFSTLNSSSYAYGTMDGTSMACPIASGTAAVILQWAKENGKMNDTNSSKDVDALIALMKKGAVSASGSGLGSGYVSIPKAMGLSTNLSKPNKITFQYANNTIFDSTTKDILIYGEAGTTVYYSLDGKTPTYKNGIAANSTGILDLSTATAGKIEAVGNAKQISIKAIAVNNITKAVGAPSSVTYKFQPQVAKISISSLSGVNKIAKGAKLQLKAVITPDFAINTAVTWEVIDKPLGITVSSSGMVSVSTQATVSKFKIKATSKDTGAKSAIFEISVVNSSVIKTIKTAKTSYNIGKGEVIDIPVTVTKTDGGKGSANSSIQWSVLSGEGVSAIIPSETGIEVTGSATPGKTVVQGVAKDGGSVTAKITITNKAAVPVESIEIIGDSYLAPDKSNVYKATVTNTNATDKKVNWSVNCIDDSLTINSSGKLTAKVSAVPGEYTVTATAADGSGVEIEKKVTVTSAKIISLSLSTSSMDIFREANRYGSAIEKDFTIMVSGGDSNASDAVEVTSSDPKMLSVIKNENTVTVRSTNNGTGKVTVTVRTTDGSNLKKTCTVNIINPPSALMLSAPLGRCNTVAYKKNMTLVPTFEQAYGTISASSKKLIWESDNPNAISVDQKGKVTALDYTGSKATITARTTDGSNLEAKYIVYSCDTISIMIPVYKYRRYSAWGGKPGERYFSEFDVFTTHGYNCFASNENGYVACNPFSYTSGSSNVNIVNAESINKPVVTFKTRGNYTIKAKSKTGDNKSCSMKWKIYY